MQQSHLSAQFKIPNKFQPLFVRGKWRNKVYKGGRGGAKSHNMARALLVMGMQETLRIACAREIQKSIKDSVYQLLVDIIRSHGLESFYTIQNDRLIGKNGTLFVFLGLKHNVTGVKSLEGVDILWVEEAENVSDNSWEVLIPTIRKPNSEIWVSFNPKNPTDPTWMRFVENADSRTLIETVNYLDNPFFPAVLEEERRRLQQNDPEAYKHVWLGEFDTRHTGYIYANYIMEAKRKGRVTGVPYERGVPVITAWDLGSSNSTSIWFAQVVGYEPRIIDFYENNNKGLEHYAEIVRSKDYDYLMHYLPHDAAHSRLGMSGSISDQIRAMGLKNKVLGQASVQSGIERARGLLAKCWIDQHKCHDGIHALNNYKYEWDDNRQMFKDNPLHDWSSDAADAFRYLAFAMEEIMKRERGPDIINKSPGLRTLKKFQKKDTRLVSRR
jgi:phage terminase large subunit